MDLTTQVHKTEGGTAVLFHDLKQNHWSAKAQPRDIVIIEAKHDTRAMRTEIAIAIRHGQGVSEIGIAKGLLYE